MPARPSNPRRLRDKGGLVFAAVVSLHFVSASMTHSPSVRRIYTLLPRHRPRSGRELRLVIQPGGEFARDNGAQHGTKVRGALGAEAGLEAGLRLLPGFAAGLQPLFARFGEMQLLGAAVGGGWFDLDQSIALERKSVAAERGPVHDHFLGQGVDGHWAEPFQLCQNRKLRHM